MIRLLPNTNSQVINIIPRDKTSLSTINLTITQDGTNKSETLTDLTASDNGNFVSVSLASTILKDETACFHRYVYNRINRYYIHSIFYLYYIRLW